MKIAVIGAGAAGSSAARFLSKAGHQVDVFEQFELGHSRGSSHGTSRIIRKSYTDPYYSGLMNEIYPLWRELEEEAGEQLYVETGVLVFGKYNSQWLHDIRQSLNHERIPFEPIGHIEVARRFGGFHIDPDEEAIFQPEAGFLKADEVIRANLRIAEANGATIHANTYADAKPDGTVNGEQYEAVAICAGAWVNKIAGLSLEPRLQHFAYFDAPIQKDIPVWIDSCEEHYYGFPDYGRGFKIGRHLYGPIVDPDSPERAPDPNVVADIAASARKRLGANDVNEAFTCLYTVAPNEDFRIGQLKWEVPAYFVSGCSGHGFKFTVWFGKLLLDLIEGTKLVTDFPRFLSEDI